MKNQNKIKFSNMLTRMEGKLKDQNFILKKNSSEFWKDSKEEYSFCIKFEPNRFNTEERYDFTIVFSIYSKIYHQIASGKKVTHKVFSYSFFLLDCLDLKATDAGIEINDDVSEDYLVNKCDDILEKHFLPLLKSYSNSYIKKEVIEKRLNQIPFNFYYCIKLILDDELDHAKKVFSEISHLINDTWDTRFSDGPYRDYYKKLKS